MSVGQPKTFALLVLLLALGHAGLAEAASKHRIHGIFISEDGQRTEFTAVEGHALIVQNAKKGLKYRLVPQVDDRGSIMFEVFDGTQPAGKGLKLDALVLQPDGQQRGSAKVPFSLAVAGIEERASAMPTSQGASELQRSEGGSRCCIICGDWMVCCEPGPGYCCEMSNNCNKYCWVCN